MAEPSHMMDTTNKLNAVSNEVLTSPKKTEENSNTNREDKENIRSLDVQNNILKNVEPSPVKIVDNQNIAYGSDRFPLDIDGQTAASGNPNEILHPYKQLAADSVSNQRRSVGNINELNAGNTSQNRYSDVLNKDPAVFDINNRNNRLTFNECEVADRSSTVSQLSTTIITDSNSSKLELQLSDDNTDAEYEDSNDSDISLKCKNTFADSYKDCYDKRLTDFYVIKYEDLLSLVNEIGQNIETTENKSEHSDLTDKEKGRLLTINNIGEECHDNNENVLANQFNKLLTLLQLDSAIISSRCINISTVYKYIVKLINLNETLRDTSDDLTKYKHLICLVEEHKQIIEALIESSSENSSVVTQNISVKAEESSEVVKGNIIKVPEISPTKFLEISVHNSSNELDKTVPCIEEDNLGLNNSTLSPNESQDTSSEIVITNDIGFVPIKTEADNLDGTFVADTNCNTSGSSLQHTNSSDQSSPLNSEILNKSYSVETSCDVSNKKSLNVAEDLIQSPHQDTRSSDKGSPVKGETTEVLNRSFTVDASPDLSAKKAPDVAEEVIKSPLQATSSSDKCSPVKGDTSEVLNTTSIVDATPDLSTKKSPDVVEEVLQSPHQATSSSDRCSPVKADAPKVSNPPCTIDVSPDSSTKKSTDVIEQVIQSPLQATSSSEECSPVKADTTEVLNTSFTVDASSDLSSKNSPDVVEDLIDCNTEIIVTKNKTEEKSLEPDSKSSLFKMSDMVDKVNIQRAEISDLKLKLNAAQQHNASLELQIRQNEEIVIKTQAEALRTEQNYQQEVKQLKQKLNENSKIIEKDRIKELEDQLKESKANEAKLSAELSQRTKDDVNYQKILDQYELTLKSRLSETKRLQEENETIRTHLTNLEIAFSDVHLKYEKTKAALQGVKANEEALLADLELAQSTNVQHEERYESLKAHARIQIEKSNKEIHEVKEENEMATRKLKAMIRRLEIKVSSLEVSLQLKTEECQQLSALCDDVTAKRV